MISYDALGGDKQWHINLQDDELMMVNNDGNQ